jgi:hypothetical protein
MTTGSDLQLKSGHRRLGWLHCFGKAHLLAKVILAAKGRGFELLNSRERFSASLQY